jgi:hypothetical protein
MSDLSELRLTEILEQYPGVPRDILAPAIDSAGIVDVTHLGQLIRAYQAGAEGRVTKYCRRRGRIGERRRHPSADFFPPVASGTATSGSAPLASGPSLKPDI